MKYLLLILFPLFLQGQSIISYDDFETGMQGWQTCYPTTHVNNWSLGTLAGNGISYTGTNAMFVTQDGASFNYGNASPDDKIVLWKSFNTVGYTNGFTLSFDWRGYGEDDIDALWVGICFANPNFVTNWNKASSGLDLTTNWCNTTWIITSPTYMNNNPNVKIGFVFGCNHTNISTSFAIDNIRLIANQSPLGIDTTTVINQTYQEPETCTYRYYNLLGQEIKYLKGLVIQIDEYGNITKLYIQ